jgi:ribosomal protein L32
MANPKRKWSKARTGRARSNWKLSVPSLIDCPQCQYEEDAAQSLQDLRYVTMANRLSKWKRTDRLLLTTHQDKILRCSENGFDILAAFFCGRIMACKNIQDI